METSATEMKVETVEFHENELLGNLHENEMLDNQMLKFESMMKNDDVSPDYMRIAAIETVFIQQNIKSGDDVRALDEEAKNSIIDVIGYLTYGLAWKITTHLELDKDE
jgi:hypothetical protein